MSLKLELVEIAKRQGGWINGGEFERLAMQLGYKASNASRELRRLAQAGRLERRISEGPARSVEYRYIPLELEVGAAQGKIF